MTIITGTNDERVHTIVISGRAESKVPARDADTFSLLLHAVERPQVKFHPSYRRKCTPSMHDVRSTDSPLPVYRDRRTCLRKPASVLRESANVAPLIPLAHEDESNTFGFIYFFLLSDRFCLRYRSNSAENIPIKYCDKCLRKKPH